MTQDFKNGFFAFPGGRIVEIALIEGIINFRYKGETDFTGLVPCDDGWWWGASGYAVKLHGQNIFIKEGRKSHVASIFCLRL